MPRQPKRAKSFAFDLLADWSAVATPLDPYDNHLGWVLHGTATLNGETGALALRGGWYGIKVGSQAVRELDMWERIDVSHGIKFKTAPGWESVPQFVCENPMGNSTNIGREDYWLPSEPSSCRKN
jgi:hypothetical protein